MVAFNFIKMIKGNWELGIVLILVFYLMFQIKVPPCG